jgi:hypothetical protein
MELTWDTLDEKIKDKIKKHYIVHWLPQPFWTIIKK